MELSYAGFYNGELLEELEATQAVMSSDRLANYSKGLRKH